MYQIILLLLLIFYNSFSFLIAQEKEKELTLEKEILVVYSFFDATGRGLSTRVTDRVIKEILEIGRFQVVDRKHLETILKEQQLSLTGAVEPSTAVEVGKILGAKKMITGNISQCSITPKTRKVKKAEKAEVLGVPVITVEKEVDEIYGYGCTLVTSLNFIDVETGATVESLELKGTGSVDKPSEDLAIGKAIDSLAVDICDRVRSIFKLKLLIAAIKSGLVYIPAGENLGIKPGFRFNVYTKGEPIVDYKGQVLEVPMIKKGEIKIRDVAKKTATANIIYGDPKPGDFIEEWVVKGITAYLAIGGVPFKISKNDRLGVVKGGTNIKFDIPDINNSIQLTLCSEYEAAEPFIIGLGLAGDISMPLKFFAGELFIGPGLKFRAFNNFLNILLKANIGVMLVYGKIGEVINPWGNVELDSDITTIGFTLGGFPELQLQFNFTDTIGLKISGGYRYFLPISKWDISATTEDDKTETILTGYELGELKLDGVYASIGISWFL